jgi:hypothetical protein
MSLMFLDEAFQLVKLAVYNHVLSIDIDNGPDDNEEQEETGNTSDGHGILLENILIANGHDEDSQDEGR